MEKTKPLEVLKSGGWSKADTFLLPVTELPKNGPFELKSYLFWNEHSIKDYKLIVCYFYENYETFVPYFRNVVMPILDKKGYLIESYNMEGQTTLILDISEWAMDVSMFLEGKYSKFSRDMKEDVLWEYYKYKSNNEYIWPVEIYAMLYPTEKKSIFRDEGKDLNAIEYVAKHYGLPLEKLREKGELGSVYDKMEETLITDIRFLKSFELHEN